MSLARHIAWIGLGSNLGERLDTLRAAVTVLARVGTVRGTSWVYETPAQGGPMQPNYYNAVVCLGTALSPPELMGHLLQVESQFGRVRLGKERNQPRTLDLDLLLWGRHGEEQWHDEIVEIPHPRLHLRTFVLQPLLDVNPALVHPTLHIPLQNLYQQCLLTEPKPVRLCSLQS